MLSPIYCQCLTCLATSLTAANHVGTRCLHIFLFLTLWQEQHTPKTALPWLDKDAVHNVLFYEQCRADKDQHQRDFVHCNYTTLVCTVYYQVCTININVSYTTLPIRNPNMKRSISQWLKKKMELVWTQAENKWWQQCQTNATLEWATQGNWQRGWPQNTWKKILKRNIDSR